MRLRLGLAALAVCALLAPHRAADAASSPVLQTDRLLAAAEAAEQECASRLAAQCLATTALIRMAEAARSGNERALAPSRGSGMVIQALSGGNHEPAMRALLTLADAVRRVAPPGGRAESWTPTVRLLAGQVAEMRIVLERLPDQRLRAAQLLQLAILTLDPLVISAAAAAAMETDPGEATGRIALAWSQALALAAVGDRAALADWLADLSSDPLFAERAGASDGAETDEAGDAGQGGPRLESDAALLRPHWRNAPRLAAYAWAVAGDAAAALAAADRTMPLPTRVALLEGLGRYRAALRPAADLRIVALAQAPDANPDIRAAAVRALIRLGNVAEAEDMMMTIDARRLLDGELALPRLVTSALARDGQRERAARLAHWAETVWRDEAERLPGGATREARLRRGREAALRLRLSAALAEPQRHREAREILAEHASAAAFAACAERGGNCLPVALWIQAVRDIPPDRR